MTVKSKDTWAKALAEATRTLFSKEELLTSVVSDPARSTTVNKKKLDDKRVSLLRGNSNSLPVIPYSKF